MPNPYPMALRTRAVAAYEAGEGGYVALATQFGVGVNTLLRWVARARTGDLAPCPKGGGWHSPVEAAIVEAVVAERPDATLDEMHQAYNRRVRRGARVSRSSIVRAVGRLGYVHKKTAAAE